MRTTTKALLLISALGLAACGGNNRFGGPGAGYGPGGAGGPGSGSGIGGPGSASDPTSVAYFNQTIGDRVLFAVDQNTLSDSAKVTLDGQAQWLATNTEYSATVEGHADEQGTREYNLALGARRASAVQNYLISKGVAPTRLSTVTYGKERPIEICSDEACYSKNRRAVTVLSAGAGF